MKSITIESISDATQKQEIMHQCDSAYSESVVGRRDFDSLLKRINDNGLFLLARKNNDVVGYAVIYINDVQNREAYITLICIRKEFQGCGYGHQLISDCIDRAKIQGMTKIRLAVLKDDVGQQGFYVHQGFEICGENEERFLMIREI